MKTTFLPAGAKMNHQNDSKNEKALRETQTPCTGCSKAEPDFQPAADPLPGVAGRPKFNQLEIVTTFTYRPSFVKIDARNFELLW